MKVFWKIFLMIILGFMIIYYFTHKLPFGLRISKIDIEYYIHDEGGRTILAEGFHIDDNKDYPKVEKMIQYSKNKLGLVVMIQCADNQKWFVAIQPKTKQNYLPELEVNYSLYSDVDYYKLNIHDLWIKVR